MSFGKWLPLFSQPFWRERQFRNRPSQRGPGHDRSALGIRRLADRVWRYRADPLSGVWVVARLTIFVTNYIGLQLSVWGKMPSCPMTKVESPQAIRECDCILI